MSRAVQKCFPSWLERCLPSGRKDPDAPEVYTRVAAAVAESLAAHKRQSDKRAQGHLRLSVPRGVNDLTADWLTTALRLRGYLEPDGEVTSVEWAPIGEGLGMTGMCALVTMLVKGAKPDTPRIFVAKFAPKSAIWDLHVRIGLQNEFHFYNDFTVKSGGLPHPKCYLALSEHGVKEKIGGISGQKPAFFLMIEYVGKNNAMAFSRVGSCEEMPQLKALMETLATFHARWWDHAPLDWTCHPDVGLGSVLFRSPYYAAALKKAIPALEAWPGNPYKPVLAWCPMLLKRMSSIVAHLREGPFTLVHNDSHLDNIFFTEEGCSFIDMSNMIFGNSLMDVAFFLSTNLHQTFRREHERELVGHYHRCLLAGRGVAEETFLFEQCWSEYRWQTLHVFLTFGIFAAQTDEQQRRTQTGAYSAPSVRTKAETEQRRIYQGDGTNPGFNGRLVAALVDLKCNELVEEDDTRKRAQKAAKQLVALPMALPDLQLCIAPRVGRSTPGTGPRAGRSTPVTRASTPGASGAPSSTKLRNDGSALLSELNQKLASWKEVEDEIAAKPTLKANSSAKKILKDKQIVRTLQFAG